MKTMFRVVTVTMALASASVVKTLAQDEPPSPPAPPAPVAIIHDVQNVTEGAVHKIQNDVEKQMREAQQRLEDLRTRVFKVHRASARTGKSLVIRSSDMAPRAQSELEEDMAIMAHILDKTLQSTDDQGGGVAMGINVSYVPGGSPTRNLYLDGYGAVFFLNVNFPLLAPPTERAVEKDRSATDSTWEEAREEVYGQPGAKSWASTSSPEYDAAKVTAVKKALLDSLKNASNIRSVRSDESITVCVMGAPSGMPLRVATGAGTYGGSGAGAGGGVGAFSGSGGGVGYGQNVFVATGGYDDAAGNKTTLTIRVKKADCEAFASGKLTPDEFRKRAAVTIYGDPAARP